MKYLFYIAKGYSIPIIKPLVNYLEKHRPNDSVRFFTSQIIKDDFPIEWKSDYILNSVKSAKDYSPDFVICPGNFVDFRIPGLKVQVFHGIGAEKESHYKIRGFFDIYLTCGPFVTEKFNRNAEKFKYFLVFETGWPKIDYIIEFDSNQLKEKYSVEKDKKVILYAPTFSDKMESATDLLDIIPTIIRKNELWLMKFHELMDKNIIEKFKNIQGKNLRVIETNDITAYLHLSDIMISDTSSVVYEFSALKKPVVTYKTMGNKNKGVDIESPDELRRTIDMLLDNPNFKLQERLKQLKRINPYLDGLVSKNVFEVLEKVKKENIKPSKNKPLNIIRKFKLLYHSAFKKGYLK